MLRKLSLTMLETDHRDSLKGIIALIDPKAVQRSKLFLGVIIVGTIATVVTMLLTNVIRITSIQMAATLATFVIIASVATIVAFLIYVILLILTVNTGIPYVGLPSLRFVKRVIKIKDVIFDELSDLERKRFQEIVDYWETKLNKGGD